MAAERTRAPADPHRPLAEGGGLDNCAVVRPMRWAQAGIESHWWANRFIDPEPHHSGARGQGFNGGLTGTSVVVIGGGAGARLLLAGG